MEMLPVIVFCPLTLCALQLEVSGESLRAVGRVGGGAGGVSVHCSRIPELCRDPHSYPLCKEPCVCRPEVDAACRA